MLVKDYDTSVPGKANSGHTFGGNLCPDTGGLDPVRDRKEIEGRLVRSPVGALLAYLKRCEIEKPPAPSFRSRSHVMVMGDAWY